MERAELYRDIAQRTQGDIYIGVVGPVRTGKSTFIKRFMDALVIPEIDNDYVRARVIDELPQSGSGKTVMTTQPKFVPNDAVRICPGGDAEFSVRMIDCVGYMVEGALGGLEEELPRMVRTPWYDYDVPFEEAAETGTRRVISEHSTIGIVVLTDGSITGLERAAYVPAEEKVFAELKHSGKPFAAVLNTTEPASPKANALAAELSSKYGVEIAPLDVMNMSVSQINGLLETVLMEFPLRTVSLEMPRWFTALGSEHPLMAGVLDAVRKALPGVSVMRDHKVIAEALTGLPDMEPAEPIGISFGDGCASYRLSPAPDVFYRILSEECGCEIADEFELMETLKENAAAKQEYDRLELALKSAAEYGYGLVPPKMDEMQLDRPEIVQHGSRFGVRLRAHASGLHIIRVDMESEVNPLVGTAEQSEALVDYLMETFEKKPDEIWQTNIFGKPIYDLVRDGMTGKANRLPPEVQMRLKDAINRMVNDGCNGLVCILL